MKDLNGVTRQPSNSLKFNRQSPKKKAIFTVSRQKKKILLAIKWFQGLSKITVLVAHPRLLAPIELFQLVIPVHVPQTLTIDRRNR